MSAWTTTLFLSVGLFSTAATAAGGGHDVRQEADECCADADRELAIERELEAQLQRLEAYREAATDRADRLIDEGRRKLERALAGLERRSQALEDSYEEESEEGERRFELLKQRNEMVLERMEEDFESRLEQGERELEAEREALQGEFGRRMEALERKAERTVEKMERERDERWRAVEREFEQQVRAAEKGLEGRGRERERAMEALDRSLDERSRTGERESRARSRVQQQLERELEAVERAVEREVRRLERSLEGRDDCRDCDECQAEGRCMECEGCGDSACEVDSQRQDVAPPCEAVPEPDVEVELENYVSLLHAALLEDSEASVGLFPARYAPLVSPPKFAGVAAEAHSPRFADLVAGGLLSPEPVSEGVAELIAAMREDLVLLRADVAELREALADAHEQ